MDHPLRIIKSNLWNDSGGAGEFRGGLGLEKVFEVARGEATITYRGERHTLPPWGLFGGLPGEKTNARIVRKDGRVEIVPPKAILRLSEGDQLHAFTAGGAGFGDPLLRPPEKVLRDYLDSRISLESARADYGVVIDPSAKSVDQPATESLRKEIHSERGPIDWTYDLGMELGRV